MSHQRRLTLSGALNVRELGGYLTKDQRQVRWGRLLRADSLAYLTSGDGEQLMHYGVERVVDLRSSAEVSNAPDQLPQRVAWEHIPLFDNDETESSATIQSLTHWYAQDARNGYRRMLRVYRRLVLNSQPQAAYRQFFDCLLTVPNSKAVLFHCSSGKDRTGMCAALLLSALGVPRATIRQDYLLTNRYCLPRVLQRVVAAQQRRLPWAFQSSMIDLTTVSSDYFDQAFTLIDREFGGVKAYLVDEVGLTPEVVRQLQRIYLTPASR